MKFYDKKGISLVELLIVIAVSALTAPILFWVFGYGIKCCSSYSRYIDQHYTVMELTQRIRKDIEEAAAFKIVYDATVDPISASVLTLWIQDTDGDVNTYSIRSWRVENGKLYLKSITGTIDEGRTATLDNSGFTEIMGGLNTATVTATPNYMPTRFEKIDERILLSIKPVAQNTVASKNRNVEKPVVTEFSIRYKDEIY